MRTLCTTSVLNVHIDLNSPKGMQVSSMNCVKPCLIANYRAVCVILFLHLEWFVILKPIQQIFHNSINIPIPIIKKTCRSKNIFYCLITYKVTFMSGNICTILTNLVSVQNTSKDFYTQYLQRFA
jgi:energy-converting hydrogenase Eha subunit A